MIFDNAYLCMDNNIAQKILDKELENIVKKVASGKTLTSSERLLIDKHYNKDKDISSVPKYVSNTTELAEILGVTRQTINKWKKIAGSPKPYSNGKHSISKWKSFVKAKGLKEADSPEDEELKSRKLLAEVKQAEIKLKVMEGTYVSIERIRTVWTQHIGQVRQILESRLLNELPPILTTLNAIEIREKLQDVLDESYKAICNSVDDIKDPVDVED